jgi:non-homologous end joining protein Ku
VDYVATEALTELVVSTNQDFLAELLKPRKAGLFETIVKFADEVRIKDDKGRKRPSHRHAELRPIEADDP